MAMSDVASDCFFLLRILEKVIYVQVLLKIIVLKYLKTRWKMSKKI